MIPVVETKDGFESISGNPVLDSLDGETKAPLLTILHESWTEKERAAYGVHLVESVSIPKGKDCIGGPRYERDRAGKVVEVRDMVDMPTPKRTTPKERLASLLASYDLTIDEFRELLK